MEAGSNGGRGEEEKEGVYGWGREELVGKKLVIGCWIYNVKHTP